MSDLLNPLEVRLQTIRDFLVPLWVEWGDHHLDRGFALSSHT